MSSPATDRIRLIGIRATGYHGVLAHERRDGQDFVIDVHLSVDLRRAGRSDLLADTVDYSKLAAKVHDRITGDPVDLIERLAALVAEDALADPRVAEVEVVVHKPQAPVGVPFGDVQVRVCRARGVPVVIALGANLGDPAATLTDAVQALAAVPRLRVGAVSPLLETDPVGGPEQPAYLNAVLLGNYGGGPHRLLRELHAIEHQRGRVREERWGPRTLDLDLIQFGVPGSADERVAAGRRLQLPHPRAAQRAFVLQPWAAIDPAAILRTGPSLADPVRRVADLLADLTLDGVRPGPSWAPTW